MTTTTTIPSRKLVATLLLLVWGGLAVSGFALIGLACWLISKGEFAGGLVILSGGVLVEFAVSFGGPQVYRALVVDGPLLEFTANGFHDKRLSTQPIPWSAIQWRAFHYKHGSIQIEVDEAYQDLMIEGFAERMNAAGCRLFGFPGYTVSPFCTGYSSVGLEELFAQFKAPQANRGSKTASVTH